MYLISGYLYVITIMIANKIYDALYWQWKNLAFETENFTKK